MVRARVVAMLAGLTVVWARLSYGAEANLVLFVANLGEVCASTTAAESGDLPGGSGVVS